MHLGCILVSYCQATNGHKAGGWEQHLFISSRWLGPLRGYHWNPHTGQAEKLGEGGGVAGGYGITLPISFRLGEFSSLQVEVRATSPC